jgi:uncharacterized repeat protein (TIGR03803 family)
MICSLLSERAGAFEPPLSVIYSFTNGLSPGAGLVIGTNGSFYGVTSTGGPTTNGGIYEVTSNGVLTNLIWFDGNNGSMPLAPLIEDKSGNFYGTASAGGYKSNGTVFELTSAGNLKLLAAFNGTNGSTPMGPLVEGTNGWYYGTTFNGGSNGLGCVFCVNTAGVLSNVFSFDGTNGANPASGLTKGSKGELYGTTEYGGANGLGTLFVISYSGTLTTLYSFTNASGSFPGGLTADNGGNLYGSTISGGAKFAGTIFEFTSSSNLKTWAAFGVTNGGNPNSSLIELKQGNLYGTTQEGGAFGQGTVFTVDARGFLTDLISFDGPNGDLPLSGMTLGSNGVFYGTTSLGGSNHCGEIYQLGLLPFIIKPPANQPYASNHKAEFSVEAGGTPPLSYQWLFSDINAIPPGTNEIPGATNASLTVGKEQLTNGGLYTVIISNAYGINTTSAVLSVVAPSVSLVSPPATVSNAALTISGKASGPNGVSIVQCQLNSNGWFAVQGALEWKTNLTLRPGTNLVQVRSFDPAGNPSTVRSVRVFYVTLSPLTLLINGSGTISTNFKGTNLIVGRSYTMQAKPARDMLFYNWTGAITTNSNPLTFEMQSNLTETANFETNPFIAAEGGYEGLFFATNGVAEQSAGLVTGLVLKTNGSYSGQLYLQGIRYGFSGSFDPAQESNVTIARSAKQGGKITMALTLNSNALTGTISGTNEGEWTSVLLAEPIFKVVGSAEYTMLIPSGQDGPTNSPPGYGYALVTNHNGSVTLSGALADGAALSQTVSIVGDGDIPFYVSLYGNTGLLLGWLNLNGGLSATNLCWIKTPSSATLLYTNGFTNMVTNALASAWTPATNDLSAGTLMISNTGLALNYTFSITNNDLRKEGTTPTNSLTGTLAVKTGLLKIIFGNGEGKETTTGYAVILGDSTNGGGYYVAKTNAGKIMLTR